MLIVNNLSCERGGNPVFQGVGFCLQEGAFLLLKGANGSGKSTLLSAIAGLIAPNEGEILWNSAPTANTREAFVRDVLYLGHKSAVKAESTVMEQLRFWARLYDTQEMLPACIHYFDLKAVLPLRIGALSAGWQRRVGLARLLLSPAKLWLLDEPTNFLDDHAVQLVATLIETRVRQGGIVISASHIMQSAVAGHVLKMEDFAA